MLISSFNIIILVMTLAYNFYYIICFSRVIYQQIRIPNVSDENNNIQYNSSFTSFGSIQFNPQNKRSPSQQGLLSNAFP